MTSIAYYQGTVEHRLADANDKVWSLATLEVKLLPHDHQLIVSVIEPDGTTTPFSATVGVPLELQIVTSRLDSDRIVDLYDESNEYQVAVRFADRAEGRQFLAAVLAGALRSQGCTRPQLLTLNEDNVRKCKGVDSPSDVTYSVHFAIENACVFHASTMEYSGDLIKDNKIECPSMISVGGSQAFVDAVAAGREENPLMALFTRAKEQLVAFVALDASQVRAASFVPDDLREALLSSGSDGANGDAGSQLTVLGIRVTSIEVSEEAKKDSLRKKLQRQGAMPLGRVMETGGTPQLRHVATSHESLGNNSFHANGSFTNQQQQLPPSAAVPTMKDTDVKKSGVSNVHVAVDAVKTNESISNVDAAVEDTNQSPPDHRKKKVQSPPESSLAAVPQEEKPMDSPPMDEMIPRKKKKSRRAAESYPEESASPEATRAVDDAACRSGSPASPGGIDTEGGSDYQQLVEFQLKLEKKKQRLLKFEADIFSSMDSVEHSRKINEVKSAEVQALRAALDADKAQFAQQQDAFRIQQFTFYQQQQEDEDRRTGKSSSAVKRGNRSVPAAPAAAASSPSAARVRDSEKEPLLFAASSGNTYSVQGPEATFSLRVDQPFYDNTTLPPAVDRCYPVTASMIAFFHHFAGVACIAAFTSGGAAVVIFSLIESWSQYRHLWPLCVLFLMSLTLHAVVLASKTKLYDGLHRLEQSCGQFGSVVFVFQRETLFAVLPVVIVVLALCLLVVLLATQLSVLCRVGIIVGLVGSTLSFGVFSLFLCLVSTVAWDRVCAIVSLEAGTLCSRLALRKAAAHYQFIKSLVAEVSEAWTPSILLMLVYMVVVMLYCLYAAIAHEGYSGLLVYDSVFAWASLFSVAVLYSITGWQKATMHIVGAISTHVDRWSRGDYNAEAADMRLEDFATLQQILFFAANGSAYAKWSLALLDDRSTFGRMWMYLCGALCAAALVMIPVCILYQVGSFDA